MKVTILAVGKMRGADKELVDEYQKRLTGKLSLIELTASNAQAENEKLFEAIPLKAFAILCDERGKDLTSRELAEKLNSWSQLGRDLVFVIGGADGINEPLKARADFCLSFGRKTWPHRLLRVMLFEQLYRAQQINQGHPYHRD